LFKVHPPDGLHPFEQGCRVKCAGPTSWVETFAPSIAKTYDASSTAMAQGVYSSYGTIANNHGA
jgi:hypothetical protein